MVPLEEHENPSDLVVSSFVLWSKSWVGISKFGVHHPEAERFEEGAEPINATSKQIRSWGRTVNLDQDPELGGGSGHYPPTLTRMLCMQNGDTGYGATMRLSEFINSDGEVSGGSKQPNIPWVQEVFYRFLEQCKTQGEAQAVESSASGCKRIKHNPSLTQTPSPLFF